MALHAGDLACAADKLLKGNPLESIPHLPQLQGFNALQWNDMNCDGCSTNRSTDAGFDWLDAESGADRSRESAIAIGTPPRAGVPVIPIYTPQPSARNNVVLTDHRSLSVGSSANLGGVERAERAVERLRWAVTEAAAALGSLIEEDSSLQFGEGAMLRRNPSREAAAWQILDKEPAVRRAHSERTFGRRAPRLPTRAGRKYSQERGGSRTRTLHEEDPAPGDSDEADCESDRKGPRPRAAPCSSAASSSVTSRRGSEPQPPRKSSLQQEHTQTKQRPVPGNMDMRTRSEGPSGRGGQSKVPLVSLEAFLGEHVPMFPWAVGRA